MALVAFSALPSSTTVVSSDIMALVIGGTTKKITPGNFRNQLFAFAAADPLNIGVLTAVGNSTITGTLSGITTLTATTGVFTNLTVPTAAQPNITSTGALTVPFLFVANTAAGNLADIGSGATNTTTYLTVSILNGTKQALLGFDSGNVGFVGTLTNHPMVIRANNAEWLRIGTTGTLTMSAAISRIVPGATSWSVRNTADAADNFIITNAGNATLAGNLTFGSATTKIAVPAGGQTDFRTASDVSSAFLISDTGAIQISSGKFTLATNTTAFPTMVWPDGALPTSLSDGMMWAIGNDLFRRIGGVTKKVTFA